MERDLKSALKGYWKDLNAKQRAIIDAIMSTTQPGGKADHRQAMIKAEVPERTYYRQLADIRRKLSKMKEKHGRKRQ